MLPSRMKIVLDTGILIAALITTNTPPHIIYQAWRRKTFELITSEWQLDELKRVSHYPKLRPYFNPSEAGKLVNELKNQTIIIPDTKLPTLEISPDPSDNPILAIALVSQAHFLISGDKKDLLSLKKIGITPIITASQFVSSFLH